MIRREFAAQRRADSEATGLRRVFQIVTGREGRAAFDRQAREAQRTVQENVQIQGLKREVQAERNQFVTGQTKDRAALIERHGIEDRQLTQAAASRHDADRAADRADRQRGSRKSGRKPESRSGSADRTGAGSRRPSEIVVYRLPAIQQTGLQARRIAAMPAR